MDEKTNELDAAMVSAMQEFTEVLQSERNEFAGYNYESYGDICRATVPYLLKHGLRINYKLGIDEDGDESMTIRLCHAASGQVQTDCCKLRYPTDHKSNSPQKDGQGAEAADTYARKRLLRNLCSVWPVGNDAVVQPAPAETKPEKKESTVPLIEQIHTALIMVKHSPKVLKEKLEKAERYAIEGKITEEELIALQEEFAND